MITGAASISVPAAIVAEAKTPRPFSLSLRISRRSLGVGRRLSRARTLRTAEAATPGAGQLGRVSVAVARAFAGAATNANWGGGGCRGGRRRHLGRRVPSGLLFGFLHAGFERLDALGKITHDAGNLALAAKQQHAHPDDEQPMPYAERTH